MSEEVFEYSKLLALASTTASGKKFHYWKVGYYNHGNKRKREVEFQSNFDDRKSAWSSAVEFQRMIEAKVRTELELQSQTQQQQKTNSGDVLCAEQQKDSSEAEKLPT